MTHASLFSGIGGFDLAAEWAGLENVFQVEIDPFCQKVLTKNFPNVQRFTDIKQFDGTPFRGTIDVLSGGFPCQPFSQAGKRQGTEDDRYLWPEMLRVIREVQPQWVVGENVAGLITWNNGMVFEQVCSDLEAEGYEVQPLVIPARAVNAPHKRERLWIIAADANCERLPRFESNNGVPKFKKEAFSKHRNYFPRTWDEMAGCTGGVRNGDGLSVTMARNEIKAYGNAIVPQVAYQIFKSIISTYDQTNESKEDAQRIP